MHFSVCSFGFSTFFSISSFFTSELLCCAVVLQESECFFPVRYWYRKPGLRRRLISFLLQYIDMQSFVLFILKWDLLCSISKWCKEECQKHKENCVLLHFLCFHSTKIGQKKSHGIEIEKALINHDYSFKCIYLFIWFFSCGSLSEQKGECACIFVNILASFCGFTLLLISFWRGTRV